MPVTQDSLSLAHAFTNALGADVIAKDTDPFVIDGSVPVLVVRPQTQDEVARAMDVAQRQAAAVAPLGGGTRRWLGMPPTRYDVALNLTALDRLVEHEPADLTVTVEAGMRLETLQRLLGERGQWLPLDPALPPGATVGGVLATNASGPARLTRGTARDLVIGMTAVTAGGELVKSGGRVVKNVAGYDMAKLHIGALGTLGVIVQASFKVAPLPIRTATAGIAGPLESLLALADAVQEARLALQGAVLSQTPAEAEWRLGLRFAGGEAAVERSLRETAALARGQGLNAEELTEATWRASQTDYEGAAIVARASVLPSQMREVAGAMSAAGPSVCALPGVGIVTGAWTGEAEPEVLRRLRETCEARQGALVLEKAPLETKRALGVWGTPRADLGLMQRLKQELDPAGVLNPGRFLGGLWETRDQR